jgi:excisionase family DNA binding protein
MQDAKPISPNSIIAAPRGLTYKQAAARFNVAAVTLRRWAADGKLKVRRFSSTCVRIPIEEIERLEKEALV